MTKSRLPDAEGISGATIRKVALGAILGVAAVAVVAVDVSMQSSREEDEAGTAVASTTAVASPTTEDAVARQRCGTPRTVTVEGTAVRWELVRESESADSACPIVTLYRDSKQVSTFELPAGGAYEDGDEGLWTYVEGAEAVAADQTVPNSDLSRIWVIARRTDGQTVSANLADGQLGEG